MRAVEIQTDLSSLGLLIVGTGGLSTMLQQGDRLDWFNSPLICVCAICAVVGVPLFLVHEWLKDPPLIKLQLLGRRNLAYGVLALFTFTILGQAGGPFPSSFLAVIQGFRPEQLYPLTLMVAGIQVVMLPLMAWALDHPSVDARFVSFVGMALVVAGCLNNTQVTSDWYPDALIASQILQGLGQPMVIMPLLMMATNAVRGPDEAPFVSAMINMPRALAEATSAWLITLIQRWRGGLHYNRLADQLGQQSLRLTTPAPPVSEHGTMGRWVEWYKPRRPC